MPPNGTIIETGTDSYWLAATLGLAPTGRPMTVRAGPAT
jgi:hypothetical protein